MEVHTIGYTKKTAAEFFGLLEKNKIKQLIDVRLNNVSQLCGFTKRDDLAYFLGKICGASYVHEPIFAPSKEIFDDYGKKRISWDQFEEKFLDLLNERKIEDRVDRAVFQTPTVLLCSEPTPDRCHRRLVAEYFQKRWGDLHINHFLRRLWESKCKSPKACARRRVLKTGFCYKPVGRFC